MMETNWIECCCWSADHAIRISCDDETVFVEAGLRPYAPWWSRIGLAAKYIFTGQYQSMWFGWEVLGHDARALRRMADQLDARWVEAAKLKEG